MLFGGRIVKVDNLTKVLWWWPSGILSELGLYGGGDILYYFG